MVAAVFALAMGPSSDLARRLTMKHEDANTLSSRYPDLTYQDRVMAAEYLMAYESRGYEPNRYSSARDEVIARMRDLQREVEYGYGDWGKYQQLTTLAQLYNFNQVMKMTNVAPVYFADQSHNVEAAEIPEEIRQVLGDKYQEYVARHVSRVIFVEHLGEEVKMLNSDRWNGMSEGGTRSAVIDTFQERTKKRCDDWQLAACLVHEAAHIDRFYSYAGDPAMQVKDRPERYACIVESKYLSSLLFNASSFPNETEKEISYTLRVVTDSIRQYNQDLGLAADDFSPEK